METDNNGENNSGYRKQKYPVSADVQIKTEADVGYISGQAILPYT